MNEPGISSRICSARSIAPFIPLAPSVSSSSAPYAFKNLRRSTLMVSGITSITLYPSAAPTIAKPIPVLPLVGSIIVDPALISPRFLASSSIASAARSFTEPDGLKNSSFKIISAPVSFIRGMRTSGVPPMSSFIDDFMFICLFYPFASPLFFLTEKMPCQ